MSISKNSLAKGENVVLTLRTHPKALLVPTLALLAMAAAVGAGWYFLPDETWATYVLWALVALAVVGTVVLFIVPLLTWWTTTYTITDRRLVTRRGIISREGRDIPLYRINDIAFEKGLLDRMLGCGTLVISDSTEKAGVRLHDVPKVERVQVVVQELLHAGDDGTDDGNPVPTEPTRR